MLISNFTLRRKLRQWNIAYVAGLHFYSSSGVFNNEHTPYIDMNVKWLILCSMGYCLPLSTNVPSGHLWRSDIISLARRGQYQNNKKHVWSYHTNTATSAPDAKLRGYKHGQKTCTHQSGKHRTPYLSTTATNRREGEFMDSKSLSTY